MGCRRQTIDAQNTKNQPNEKFTKKKKKEILFFSFLLYLTEFVGAVQSWSPPVETVRKMTLKSCWGPFQLWRVVSPLPNFISSTRGFLTPISLPNLAGHTPLSLFLNLSPPPDGRFSGWRRKRNGSSVQPSQQAPIYLGQQLSSQSDVSTCVRVSI